MLLQTVQSLVLASFVSVNTGTALTPAIVSANRPFPDLVVSKPVEKQLLAQQSMSLAKRYAAPSVNEVFKDNILYTLARMRGLQLDPKNVDWNLVNQPFEYDLTLKPGQTFAFQDDLLPEYQGKVVQTTNSHFNAQEGFKFSGLYYGDGVCHLASLIHWAASDAKLDSVSLVNHDFAVINEVPKQYGVSIYSDPNSPSVGQRQNLYVTNNQETDITIKFTYNQDQILRVAVYK